MRCRRSWVSRSSTAAPGAPADCSTRRTAGSAPSSNRRSNPDHAPSTPRRTPPPRDTVITTGGRRICQWKTTTPSRRHCTNRPAITSSAPVEFHGTDNWPQPGSLSADCQVMSKASSSAPVTTVVPSASSSTAVTIIGQANFTGIDNCNTPSHAPRPLAGSSSIDVRRRPRTCRVVVRVVRTGDRQPTSQHASRRWCRSG